MGEVKSGTSTGVLFPHDLRERIDKWVDENYPRTTYPSLKVAHVHTALVYAGMEHPKLKEFVDDYLQKRAPNAKLARVNRMAQELTPEERAALIKQWMDEENNGTEEIG